MKQIFITLLLLCGLNAAAADLHLTPENTISFRGEVNDETVGKVMQEVARLNSLRAHKRYPLYLVIDSPGGDIGAGEDLVQYLLTIPNLETVTVFGASMASAIVQALPGRRHITENGIMMFHRAKIGLQGQVSDGEFDTRLRLYKAMINVLETRNADRMKVGLSWYKNAVKDELWHLGDESVSGRTADEVSRIYCSEQLIAKKEVVNIRVFMFSMPVQFSGCPLFKQGIVLDEKDAENYLKYKASIQNLSYWSKK